MIDDITILCACIFGCVTLLALWLIRLLGGGGESRVRTRLSNAGGLAEEDVDRAEATPVANRGVLWQLVSRMGQAAAKPFMPQDRAKQSGLRRRLAMAGIYSPSAIRLVVGFKMILLGMGVVGGYAVGSIFESAMLGSSIGGLVGYLAPVFWIKRRITRQQRALEYGLPDALDLMVICVEAGLAMDAAMERVGQELAFVHPRLSRELDIAHMETRVGLSRTESLRNLGTRTASPPLQSLASMLVQAERFGTSIGAALRVHADGLRTSRLQKAEEMAAKASVKISFPLVLFILPATFIVLAGPTIVELLSSSLMK
jgi:tight adherence protein C